MPSDDRAFAFSSRVPPKALKIKAPYKAWHYQFHHVADQMAELARPLAKQGEALQD